MPCCVPRCSGNPQLISFPQAQAYRQRWQEAVEVATQTALKEGPEYKICLDHFARPDDLDRYQEPTRFKDGKGNPVILASCRFCQRFVPKRRSFLVTGKLAELTIRSVLYQSLRIRLTRNSFLRRICQECLAQVDLARAIQDLFDSREVSYYNLEKLLPDKLHAAEYEVKRIDDPEDDPPVAVKVEVIIEEEHEPTKPSVDPEKKKKRGKKVDKDTKETKRKYVFKTRERKKPAEPPKKNLERVNVARTRKCYICNLEFPTRDEMVVHLTQNHVANGEYECAECNGKQFRMISSYNSHLSMHNATERPFKCGFCNLRYTTRYVRMVHENREHGAEHKLSTPAKRVYNKQQCELCGKQFASATLAKQHKLLIHDRVSMAQCKICAKSFSTYGNLQRHMLQHTEELPYKCDICNATFRVSADLNKHVLRDHEGKSPYECKACQISLQTKEEYDRHRSVVHQIVQRRYKCLACGEGHLNTDSIREHIAISHGDNYPYLTCPDCPSLQFTCKAHLTSHRSNKHAAFPESTCETCGKAFKKKFDLDMHIKTVHLQQKDFVCQTCGKRLTTKLSLQRHQDTHNTVRMFSCSYCDATFSYRRMMENHIRNRHTGEMPFECEYCGEKFKDSTMCSRHRRKHRQALAPDAQA